MDLVFGTLLIYGAWTFLKHFRQPAKASRGDIKIMALIIIIYAGGYGAYNIWLGFGGAPFGGLG